MFVKKELLGLPVETKSGEALGVVADVEIDPSSHLVMIYQVKASKILPGLFSKSLLISRQQVLSVTSEKVVVEDSVIKDAEPVLGSVPSPG